MPVSTYYIGTYIINVLLIFLNACKNNLRETLN